MIINDFILKNEKLTTQMKILNDNLAELEQFYYSIDMNKETSRIRTSAKHQINRAKEGFRSISAAYDEETHNKLSTETTDALVSEAQRYCDDIDVYLFKRNKK
jgi:hypothetical protein